MQIFELPPADKRPAKYTRAPVMDYQATLSFWSEYVQRMWKANVAWVLLSCEVRSVPLLKLFSEALKPVSNTVAFLSPGSPDVIGGSGFRDRGRGFLLLLAANTTNTEVVYNQLRQAPDAWRASSGH